MVDAVVMAAGTALVGAMATDMWEQARASMVSLWRRIHPAHAETVETDLDRLREQVIGARRGNRADTEAALVGGWQGRLQQLLLDRPDLVSDLRRVLDETLASALSPEERGRLRVVMHGSSHDHSTFNQVAGTQINLNLGTAPLPPRTTTPPADTAAFTGRTRELREITRAVTKASGAVWTNW